MEHLSSLIRTIMSLIGAFLVGGGAKFFGSTIDDALWDEIVGVVITIASIYWSIKTKTINVEKLQGSIRHVATFICGILLAKGILNEQTGLAVIAFSGAIIPYIQAFIARKKAAALQKGEIVVQQLKTDAP